METGELFLEAALVTLSYMSFMFILALIKKDNSIVDVAWGLGFILLAFYTLIAVGNYEARQIIVTALVTIWGLRLAVRIFIRNRGKGEDFRYKKWRADWGKYWVIRSYLQVFLLQGVMMMLIASAFIIINSSSEGGLGVLDALGILIWLTGFAFEAVSDYQLDKFKADEQSKGKILDTGLWRYSRHPNYFGEVVQWWGIFIMALMVEGGWAGIISPFVITFLILKISGIPILEKAMSENPAFKAYKAKTSVFFPLPPKE